MLLTLFYKYDTVNTEQQKKGGTEISTPFPTFDKTILATLSSVVVELLWVWRIVKDLMAKQKGIGYWQSLRLTGIVIIVLVAVSLLCRKSFQHSTDQEQPSTTTERATSVVMKDGFVVVVTEPRITSEAPPPPVDSIVITNELQLQEIISRRKPKSKPDTNVVSPARLTEEQR